MLPWTANSTCPWWVSLSITVFIGAAPHCSWPFLSAAASIQLWKYKGCESLAHRRRCHKVRKIRKMLSTKLHRAAIKGIAPEHADFSDSPPWRLRPALLNWMPGTRDCSRTLLGTQLGWASLLKQPSPAGLYLLHQGMLLLQQPFKDNRQELIWWAASKLQPEQACWHIANTCFHNCSFPHLQLSFGQINLLIN